MNETICLDPKQVVPDISRPTNIDTNLMHWMSVKSADNFQIREYSWPHPFHFILFQKPACIGLKEDLCVVSMSPAVENTLSHGTEVAGIPKINIDTVEISGYL